MATLKQLCSRSRYKSRARLITVANVQSAIGATQPPNVHTSTLFCSFVCLMTAHYRSPTCDTSTTLLEAGAIPVIFAQLSRWPRERCVAACCCLSTDRAAALLRVPILICYGIINIFASHITRALKTKNAQSDSLRRSGSFQE